MPTVTNKSSDDLNMPSVGLSLLAGEVKKVEAWVAEELKDHPLLHVDFDEPAPAAVTAPAVEPEPPADPPVEPTPEAAPAVETPAP